MIVCAAPLFLLVGIIGNGPQGVVVTKPNRLLETRNHILQIITPITQLNAPFLIRRCADSAVEGLILLKQLARISSCVQNEGFRISDDPVIRITRGMEEFASVSLGIEEL